ncbi:GntR family transcriptional regulator [Acuticoccus kandeliae]|uniref:GntR family transcriptional regulator n=1 Tax=Acuticoccus kandeliae TaxID=2073160 RepID=UPI000D3E7114|nr:GntR family transcriptional regulator [Acuticoccus kandeliae]
MLDKDASFSLGSTPPLPSGKRVFAGARLRQAVLWCELAPGSVISEPALMERYGLNRAGVRAALVGLEAEGLVEARPRAGWQIRPVTGAYIGETIAARRAIEPALPIGALRDDVIARVKELSQLIAVFVGRTESTAITTARAYDRELLDVLASGLGEMRRRWIGEAWDHSDRIVRFFESGGAARLGPVDRAPLAAACAARDTDSAIAALATATDRLEAFVKDALYADMAEIVRPAAKPTRARRRQEPARQDEGTRREPPQPRGRLR